MSMLCTTNYTLEIIRTDILSISCVCVFFFSGDKIIHRVSKLFLFRCLGFLPQRFNPSCSQVRCFGHRGHRGQGVHEAGYCTLHIMTFPGAQSLFTVDHRVSAAVKDSQTTSIRAPLSHVPCAPFRHASESAGLRRRRAARKGGTGGFLAGEEWSQLQGVVGRDLGHGSISSPAGKHVPVNRWNSAITAKFSSVFLRGYLFYNL